MTPETWSAPLGTLAGRRLALVVTGGVAAYKAAELARLWVRAGAQVRAVLTENGARFVTPLTFGALTGQPAYVGMWDQPGHEIGHVALADWAEAAVVAPATADFLAKMAHGLADGLASTFMLAFGGPVLAAPAMNSRMLAAAATQANLATLKERGVAIAEPASGPLACGATGQGRLADIETIALMAARALGPGDFAGRAVAVTAGSTHEPWDDIRFIANRSTGKMGLNVALAAWLRGAEVLLVAGGGFALPVPAGLPGFTLRRAESTADMLAALEGAGFDALIMAAAPADFRPAQRLAGKIKKGGAVPALPLAPNPDILKSLPRRPGRLYVGFAAEDDDLLNRAAAKLRDKDLDLIAANAIGEGFAGDTNHLWLLARDGQTAEITPRPKFAAAWAILDSVRRLCHDQNGG